MNGTLRSLLTVTPLALAAAYLSLLLVPTESGATDPPFDCFDTSTPDGQPCMDSGGSACKGCKQTLYTPHPALYGHCESTGRHYTDVTYHECVSDPENNSGRCAVERFTCWLETDGCMEGPAHNLAMCTDMSLPPDGYTYSPGNGRCIDDPNASSCRECDVAGFGVHENINGYVCTF